MQVIRRDVDECSDYSSLLGGAEGGGAVDLNAGYIQHCIVNQGFEKIHEYDLYRLVYLQSFRNSLWEAPSIRNKIGGQK